MKNTTQPATGKLVKQFDIDLKNMLMVDLKAFKVKGRFANRHVVQLRTASAA